MKAGRRGMAAAVVASYTLFAAVMAPVRAAGAMVAAPLAETGRV